MPTRTSTPLGAPCWIDLMSSDTERSCAFYGALLGWDVEDAGPEYGGYLTFAKDGAKVAGAMANTPEMQAPDGWSVYLASDDAKASVAAATAHGGAAIVPAMDVPDLGVMAVVADPAGALIGIWQPGAHRGFEVVDEPGAPTWFELHTRDHAGALTFYRDVFGWDVHTVADTDEFRYSTFGDGDDALAGIMDAAAFLPDGVGGLWTVYFRVEDVDAAVARAVELGASVDVAPEDTPYGRLAQLVDPTGATFKLQSIG